MDRIYKVHWKWGGMERRNLTLTHYVTVTLLGDLEVIPLLCPLLSQHPSHFLKTSLLLSLQSGLSWSLVHTQGAEHNEWPRTECSLHTSWVDTGRRGRRGHCEDWNAINQGSNHGLSTAWVILNLRLHGASRWKWASWERYGSGGWKTWAWEILDPVHRMKADCFLGEDASGNLGWYSYYCSYTEKTVYKMPVTILDSIHTLSCSSL